MRARARLSVLIALVAALQPAGAQEPQPARPTPRPELTGPAPETRPETPSPKQTTPDEAGPEMPPLNPQADAAVDQDARPPQAENLVAYASCLAELWANGTSFQLEPRITQPDNPACGISRPIKVSQILPGITLEGSPVMRCETAQSLLRWLRDEVGPAARFLPGAPNLVAIQPGSTYQCRQTVGGDSSRISEHALGNAFDIAAFQLSNGESFVIAPRGDSGDMEMAFQAAIRASACLYFSTVLGPGANAAHNDHLHLDIKARKGGYRLCQ